jgi:hypothetical protein
MSRFPCLARYASVAFARVREPGRGGRGSGGDEGVPRRQATPSTVMSRELSLAIGTKTASCAVPSWPVVKYPLGKIKALRGRIQVSRSVVVTSWMTPITYSKRDGSPVPLRRISGSSCERSTTVVGTAPHSPESITASTA